MSARIWFNARVLCCEESPYVTAVLQAAKARVSWAPLGDIEGEGGPWRVLPGDWADPEYPYRLVEGHEVVLLRWPQQPCSGEQVRWWLTGAMHLCQSARRCRVRALGFSYALESPPLLLNSAQFLTHYLATLDMPTYVTTDIAAQNWLKLVEAGLAPG